MPKESKGEQANNATPRPTPGRFRRLFSRRNVVLALFSGGALLLLFGLLGIVSYRTGLIDSYIKSQFIDKMNYIGIEFTADEFRVGASPLELVLKNAQFNDRVSGEKLFFVENARIGLSVENLFAWQLSRDISVTSTDISGAQVWIKFDENGRSNFANIVEDTRESRLNFKYDTVKLNISDSVIHFNDLSRSIGAEARNFRLTLAPEAEENGGSARYAVDITSSDSNFRYEDRTIEDISIRAKLLANSESGEIKELRIETPLGTSYLKGVISNWAEFAYDLSIESTVDLTRASSIFPLGASLGGVGNFKGKVSGRGERYKIAGVVDSQAISAESVYLRGLNVDATVEGTNRNYEANGKAIAELLTFEDFRIEFPQLSGNVRGTGTDFRWVGELQAIAAKSRSLTLGRLFLSDAVAEYKDQQLTATVGNGRAQRFSVADFEFSEMVVRDLKLRRRNGELQLSAPTARASSLKSKDVELNGMRGEGLSVADKGERTQVRVNRLVAESGRIRDTRGQNISADEFQLVDLPGSTELTAKDLRVDRTIIEGARIDGLNSPFITLRDNDRETIVYSDKLRVARIDAGSAVLGSLNIAGVRLTIRQGRLQATSNDIDAGNIRLAGTETFPEGGTLENVGIAKPIFVLEPSGRYRASADMSIGGGIIGSIPLGSATARVDINNDRAALDDLVAEVMNGKLEGNAAIALNRRGETSVRGDFSGLDLSKLIAVRSGRVMPIAGTADGNIDLRLRGTDLATADGLLNATIAAAAGSSDAGRIPLNGEVRLAAQAGEFNIERAEIRSDETRFNASGKFGFAADSSNVRVELSSSNAREVERIVRVLGISPELEKNLDDFQAEFAGSLNFDGRLTGDISDPEVRGTASIASVSLRGRELGAVRSEIVVSEDAFRLENGLLKESRGNGEIEFTVNVPATGSNNISVDADLRGVDAGNLLAALPIELPERIRDFSGRTNGEVKLRGLPNAATGNIDLSAANGTIAGEAFDTFKAQALFSGTRIDIQEARFTVGDGRLTGRGFYERSSTEFNLSLDGEKIPAKLVAALLPPSSYLPSVEGAVKVEANVAGKYDDPNSYDVSFSGAASELVINENSFGEVQFSGRTRDRLRRAEATATLEGRPQRVTATLNFADQNLPFQLEHNLDNSPLRPFLALIPQLRGISIGGTATGRVQFGGDLSRILPDGQRELTASGLSGTINLSQLSLQIQDTPLSATEPVLVRFTPYEIVFENAKLAGGGTNIRISGTKAFNDNGMNDLALDGRVNLALLNVLPPIASTDTFFGGFADLAVRLQGPNRTARLSGTATTENASIAAFIGSERLSFDRVKSRILFASDQAQIASAEGYLGGGKFVANGGVLFGNDLQINSYRVGINGTNVTVPLPDKFITTGDARLEITGNRIGTSLTTLISGSILARRSLYTSDIDLASIVGGRREGALTGGGSVLPTRFNLSIEGRDALVVRNNIADLTATVSLRLTGTSANPILSGRIVANEGTVFFRKDRYQVQRGVLEFPPNTQLEPILSLIAEADIAGYQIFVNISGPLTDTELLNVTVRSSPALPQADVVSLITTGSLSNTERGISTIASTGINTAAEVITDSIINNPARRATDRLFGLNVFEIDPIISGDRVNPTARLTVGRQINNNLRVTYATNLSQDQNQVLALEYRVSNRLSVVAQYEQRSLSNVTRNRDNFSFEVRFRRRF